MVLDFLTYRACIFTLLSIFSEMRGCPGSLPGRLDCCRRSTSAGGSDHRDQRGRHDLCLSCAGKETKLPVIMLIFNTYHENTNCFLVSLEYMHTILNRATVSAPALCLHQSGNLFQISFLPEYLSN